MNAFIFFPFSFSVVADKFFTNHCHSRIVPQALLLQSCIFLFIIILIFSYLQLGLTLYSHLIFLTVKSNAFFQTLKLIIIRQGLLFQIQALLLHFNLLLLVGNHLFFPFITLIFNVTK